jgi:hypothetical protein
MQIADIDVKTVDGYEGREKEVIIFSTVRNNPGGYIGFLKASKQSTTSRVSTGAESWRRYVQFLSEQGLVVRVGGAAPPSRSPDGLRAEIIRS